MADDLNLPWSVSIVPFGTAVVVDSNHRVIAMMPKKDEHIAHFIAQRANQKTSDEANAPLT